VVEIEYEPRDMDLRFAAKVFVGFLLLAVFGGGVSLGVYLLIGRFHERQERPAAPLALAPGRLPPVPRLQSTPQADLAQLRAQQLRDLTSYGWVNQAAGTTRIRIDEAMRLYVERAAARGGAPGSAPAQLDLPAAAAGASGTATVPAVAPTPSAAPPPRPHP
jgi:hypothetical protein